MLRDYLAGLAQTRQLPLRVRIVLLLAAGEADLRFTGLSWEDMMRLLSVNFQRKLQQGVEELERMHMIERIPPAGSRPWLYRLRSPLDWTEPAWIDDRKGSLARVAFLWAGRARVEAALSTPETGRVNPFVPTKRSGPPKRVVSTFKGVGKKSPSLPVTGGDNGAPPSLTPSETGKPTRIDSEGREEGGLLSEKEKAIAIAFMEGTTAKYLKGALLKSVVGLAEQANGSFDAVKKLAADPLFGANLKWPDRVQALRDTIHQIEAPSGKASCGVCGATGALSSCIYEPAEEGCPYGGS